MSVNWEKVNSATSTFNPEITPLILAAHRNNYEILKLLLDRGATLPMPHDVRCGCDECAEAVRRDCLRHSRSRINAFRALSSPSLICLSSVDPILTAFELSLELKRLSYVENEFKVDYKVHSPSPPPFLRQHTVRFPPIASFVSSIASLPKSKCNAVLTLLDAQKLQHQCQDFATSLLDHIRTSAELACIMNHQVRAASDNQEDDSMSLARLELAIAHQQKKTSDIESWFQEFEAALELNSFWLQEFMIEVLEHVLPPDLNRRLASFSWSSRPYAELPYAVLRFYGTQHHLRPGNDYMESPTDSVCHTQNGATCHLFAYTMGGTMSKSAATSHVSSKATASMIPTADDAPVMPLVEQLDYDSPALQACGQHTVPIPRSPEVAAIGGDIATYVAFHGLG
ncbi:hypothetical protein HPB51_013044 [Rhipicephalus microplus]|uniref:Transient receptor ion channel domain-containing protein n=1 Tax=Rhipicephalus microplus TaxID=6941 RepID=A0A9J6F294_RHIMP|nr:hypothetical protein HPB51_013044 [Rhipicephalus microplus]